MQRAYLEGAFQRAFANTDLYVAPLKEERTTSHGNVADEWEEFRFLCRCDVQTLQGEEAPSHRDGGSRRARLYVPADIDLPTRALLRMNDDPETWRVVGIPRTQPEGHGWTQVTLVDVERYEG